MKMKTTNHAAQKEEVNVDPCRTAHFEVSRLRRRCLQSPLIATYGTEGAKRDGKRSKLKTHFALYRPIIKAARA